jgi:hypothetical protein
MLTLGRGVVAILILAVLDAGSLEPASVTPVWKIGRAVVERVPGPLPPGWQQPEPGAPGQPPLVPGQPSAPGQPPAPGQGIPVVKLSLRNEGAPGNVQVQIRGRPVAQPPQAFRLLGTFAKEVAFKQTAIVQVLLLFPSGPPGQQVELAVMTGHQETDRQVVRVPD